MPTPTYESIFSYTLTSSAASVLLGSGGTGTIPSTYTDLVLVSDGKLTAGGTNPCRIKLNGDSGTNYSWNRILVYATGWANDQQSGVNGGIFIGDLSSYNFTMVTTFPDYANTDVYKSVLSQQFQYEYQGQYVGRWASTAAISSILITPVTGPFEIGTTFSLYGIKAGN